MAAGAGSFAGGFARAIGDALVTRRREEREDTRRAEERQDRLRSALLPVLLENVEDPADLEPFLAASAPGQFKGKQGKKAGRTLTGAIGDFMKGGLLGRKPEQQPTSTGPAPLPGAPVTAPAPATTGNGKVVMTDLDTQQVIGEAPATGRRTLMGVPIMSAEEKIDRSMSKLETETTAKVDLARRMLPRLKEVDPTATMDDALAVVGIRTPSATARSAATMQAVHGKDADGNDVSAVFDRSQGAYVYPVGHAKAGQPIPGFVQTSTARETFGVDREAIAMATFGQPFGKLNRNQQAIVLREENLKLQEEAKNRRLGTGQGAFQSPIDIKTAQETGVPTGTTAAQVAGQTVPTQQNLERRRSVIQLQEGLTDIRDRLLVALPSEKELGGLAPGAAYAIRRRLPQHRNDIAKLESAINNIVNVMARAVGEQRGTQTERDAMRAEAAIASLQDALLTGDTQESAKARITESLAVVERILQQIPQPVVPGAVAPAGAPQPTPGGQAGVPAAAPAPAAAAPGTKRKFVQDAQGNWVLPQ